MQDVNLATCLWVVLQPEKSLYASGYAAHVILCATSYLSLFVEVVKSSSD